MEKKEEKNKSFIAKLFTFILLIGFAVLLYSHFIGTKGLLIREYNVTSDKIPTSFNGFKIVHFSDLHYGTTIKEKELKKLVDEINDLKPDLVVFTGDLLDGSYVPNENDINIMINELNRIDSNIGNYIINGNHDSWKEYNQIIENINFKDLNNKNELIYNKDSTPILLVGLDDLLEGKTNMEEAFNYEYEEDYYTILLLHEPDLIDTLPKNVDIALAGHSHNGQIRLPFIGKIYTPKGAKKYYDEVYNLNNTTLYISGGLGTSDVPFRLLVKPSFNFYRLYSK